MKKLPNAFLNTELKNKSLRGIYNIYKYICQKIICKASD